MKRWIAAIFLALAVFYLGAASADRCSEERSDCVQVCHIVCADGCTTAPLPVAPKPPPPDPLPRSRHGQERVDHLITLVIEPEKDPPKA